MRPVWLQMKAFGPYAGTQVVDFRELGANRLFLITGSTGAGKSTILDAICFALYGRTSGKEREGRQMRSDFASPDDPTEVTLDFSLGENCYRIWRTPEQDRPRKRGSGTVSQKPDATLWKISAPGEEHGAKTEVIASQWSKVTAEVIDLLGFEHDQFRQVIMLPQGQFRKVLNAGSKEREDILEVLFRTGIFSQIEEALKLAAKDLSADMDRLKSKSQIILGQAGAEDRNELDELCKRQEKSAGEFEARLKALRKKEESAREALEAASRLEEKFAEREQADLALSELEAEKSEIEMDRSRLERARKASKLAGVEDNLKDRLAEAEERREQAASSEEELERAETARAAAMTDFAREKKKTGRRDRTQKRLHQLDGLATKVGELESSLHNLAAAEDHVKALRDERDSRKADLKKLRAKIRSLKKSLEKKSKKAGAAEALEEKSRRSRKELEQRRKLTAVRGTLSQARKDRTAARKVLKAAGSECEILRKKIERLETLWRSAQAGILARGLRKGRPCPVCGSTEHPEPARLEKNVPEESTLVELRARLERLENKREEMRGRDSDARAGVSRLEAEIDSLKEALGAGAGISLKRLEAADRKLGADLETARRARDEAEKMSGDLRGLKDEERAAVRAFEDAEAKLTRGLEARALNQATVKERQAAIPRSLRTASALEDARRE
ncbi:MAG: SMC family ATPase, partial [bacterium]